jgi:hypothetical protein
LILPDVDHFKELTNGNGRQAGDEVGSVSRRKTVDGGAQSVQLSDRYINFIYLLKRRAAENHPSGSPLSVMQLDVTGPVRVARDFSRCGAGRLIRWRGKIRGRVRGILPLFQDCTTMSDSAGLPDQRFQFSLRGLLVVMTLAALVFGLSAAGVYYLVAYVLYVVFPVPLVMAVIYARGDVRAFAIGGIVPWATMTFGATAARNGRVEFGTIIWLVVVGGICGATAVWTRRWIQRSGFHSGPD